jgi:hypothetical protein
MLNRYCPDCGRKLLPGLDYCRGCRPPNRRGNYAQRAAIAAEKHEERSDRSIRPHILAWYITRYHERVASGATLHIPINEVLASEREQRAAFVSGQAVRLSADFHTGATT